MRKELKLKVCGMRDSENIIAVSQKQPDYMGFIFYAKSPRYVGIDFVIPEKLSPGIQRVGVFVNASISEMIDAALLHRLDYLQLHGDESPEVVFELKEAGLKIWKVFSIDDEFDFARTAPYENLADLFLFDTRGRHYGGNAQTFKWDVLTRYNQSIPFMLSGGIGTNNIDDVSRLKEMNLYGIDINSGVEDSPGMKNLEKIQMIREKLINIQKIKSRTL